MEDFKSALNVLESLVDWYWLYGTQRTAGYRISSSWLDKLYAMRGLAADASLASPRPATGIWGPSQAGKSSMLSQYIDVTDADEDPQGINSAITWNVNYPARFRGGSMTRVSLNPFNGGSDATGCVTRYTLRESVEDTKYPVEIKIASRKALIHAMAAGYLSECDLTNNGGEKVFLNAKRIDDFLDDKSIVKPGNGTAVREAYELLREVCSIIGSLIGTKHDRYRNLNTKQMPWRSIVLSKLLQNDDLTGSISNVEAFMSNMLWDNCPGLNMFMNSLLSYQKQLQSGDIGGKRVFCTMEAAAILISIDSYRDMLNPANEKAQIVANKIRSLRYEVVGDKVLLSCGEGSRALCPGVQDFGFFQACVLELVVPLRKVNGMPKAFCEFIEKTDFLDFPGVAQQPVTSDGSGEANMNPATLSPNEPELLTRLMKRGRTASIISSYSEQCDIDNFVLTVRSGTVITNPGQLINGITQWWHNADAAYDHTSRTKPPLPLYFVLTFCAKVVNDVIANGNNVGNGMEGVFQWLNCMGPMATPQVANIFASTYKSYPSGAILDARNNPIRDASNPDLLKSLNEIYRDASFRRFFGSVGSVSQRSFDLMAKTPDGGTDFFFENVAKGIDATRKERLLAKKLSEIDNELKLLLDDAKPDDDNEGLVRKRFLDEFADKIMEAMKKPSVSEIGHHFGFDNQIAWVSFLIRRLQNVNVEKLAWRVVDEDYINAQLDNLGSHLPEFGGSWPAVEIGLEDRGQAERLVTYLIDRSTPIEVDGQVGQFPLKNQILEWYRGNGIDNVIDKDCCLRQLAMVIENVVWHGYEPVTEVCSDESSGEVTVYVKSFLPPSNPGVDFLEASSAVKKIEGYCGKAAVPGARRGGFVIVTGPKSTGNEPPSPEMDAVIKPFVKYIRKVAEESASGGRGVQAGDEQLDALKASLR